jgi:hypothetical protein
LVTRAERMPQCNACGRGQAPTSSVRRTFASHGRLAALTGDVNAAIRAYQHYVRVRAEPEPSMLPDLEAAKRELARLEKAAGGK